MLDNRPTLSIIIPALCADLELRRCVDSVRLACGTDPLRCEVILVMPKTEVGKARLSISGVNKFATETGRGIYSAMNDGIKQSEGSYLYFVGKDDIVLPNFATLLDQLGREGESAVFFDVYWGKSGAFSGKPSKWTVLVRNFCHQGIIYSREVIDEHGPYWRKFRVQADHFLNIRLLWDERFAPSIRYFSGGRVWYAADGFSSLAKDRLFWRLYPAIAKRFVGAWAGLLIIVARRLRGK